MGRGLRDWLCEKRYASCESSTLPASAANMHAMATTNKAIASRIGMVYSFEPRLAVDRPIGSRSTGEAGASQACGASNVAQCTLVGLTQATWMLQPLIGRLRRLGDAVCCVAAAGP